MKLVSVEQMRNLDTRTINEAGIPGELLMLRAGEGAGEAILEFINGLHPNHLKRFVLLAGKGNNGGDAYVVAKYLFEHTDVPVELFTVCPFSELKGDALLHAKKLPEGISVFNEIFVPRQGDVIIDGLLGTGISGPLRPPYDDWISIVNNSGMPVISLDIPSGMNGDDGAVATRAVKADLTITMGQPKQGFIMGYGPELCGIMRCVDIGIPKSYVDEIFSDLEISFACDIKSLSRRPMESFKNRNGHVLVIGGSRDFPGAPVLAGKAAMRSGAGLVTVAVPHSSGISTPDMYSLIFNKISDSGEGCFSIDSVPDIKTLSEKADVIIIGPGISTDSGTLSFLREIFKIPKPMIIDADALNLISETPEILERDEFTILTPHPGEMKRLLEGFELPIGEDRIESAKALASKKDSIIVLKGNRTVISSSDGKIIINGSGTPALASAGSGDVLCGIIAAFIAQGNDVFQSTLDAVFIHGSCGEYSPLGIRGMTADDLIDLIPEKMMDISPFA